MYEPPKKFKRRCMDKYAFAIIANLVLSIAYLLVVAMSLLLTDGSAIVDIIAAARPSGPAGPLPF